MKIQDCINYYENNVAYLPVGQGWKQLLFTLLKKINKINKNIEIVQIKEKFGGLRVYVSSANDKIYDLIYKAENESFNICEHCGSKQNVETKGKNWISTLCKKCRKEFHET
jgi:hypothetical protein